MIRASWFADEDISDQWDTTSEEGEPPEPVPEEVKLQRSGSQPDLAVPSSALGGTHLVFKFESHIHFLHMPH